MIVILSNSKKRSPRLNKPNKLGEKSSEYLSEHKKRTFRRGWTETAKGTLARVGGVGQRGEVVGWVGVEGVDHHGAVGRDLETGKEGAHRSHKVN